MNDRTSDSHVSCAQVAVLRPEPPLPALTGRQQLKFWRQQEPSYRGTREFVYAVQGSPGTPVKIGRSTNPLKRLRTLQTGSADTLDLLHVFPGHQDIERELHQRFAQWRHRDEWFGGENLDVMLEILDAIAHYLIRDQEAMPWYSPRLITLTGLPAIEAIRSRAEVATLRREIEELWNNGLDLRSIAAMVDWNPRDISQELMLMGRDPRYHLRAAHRTEYTSYPTRSQRRKAA